MSIIQAKATRGTGKPETPNRELYEDKMTNRVSQIPFYVGASLSALVLYFKNSLVTAANARGVDEIDEQRHSNHHSPHEQQSTNPLTIRDADLKKICLPGSFDTMDGDHTPKLLKHSSLWGDGQAGHIQTVGITVFDSLDASYAGSQEGNLRGFAVSGSFPAFFSNDNRLGSNSYVGGVGPAASGNANTPQATNGMPGITPDATKAVAKPAATPPKATPPTTPVKSNHAPVVSGFVTLPDLFVCDIATILVAELLKNAVDPDGDKLSVTNVKINGTSLTLDKDHYTYDGNDMGFVTVTYNVTDGKLSTADTAIIDFLPRPAILGTDGNDTLVGTDCGDNISAGAGDDTIHGNQGDDVIYAGSGDDIVYGDAGNDVIYGGDGNDTLYGGDGNDTIFGGNGDDTIYGGTGNNFLFGGSGNDVVYAGDGNNTVFGGPGRDWIFAGAGSNKMFGGIGNDTFFANANSANNYFDGGEGVNKLNYAAATTSLKFDLNNGTVTATGTGTPIILANFSNIQVVQGGVGPNDFLAKITPIPAPANPLPHHEDAPPVALVHPDDKSSSPASATQTSGPAAGSSAAPENAPVSALDHEVTDTVPDLPDAAVNQGYTFLGGVGVDTLDCSSAQQAITIDVVHGMAHGAEIGTDYFSSVERFITGSGDDTFIGAGQGTAHHMTVTDAPDVADLSAGPVVASSAPGNNNLLILDDVSGDKISGAAADQFFDGGAGFNTINYSKATHAVEINVAAGTATGDDIGHDKFANIQHFIGGSGSDHFTIGSGNFVLEGHGGGDTFTFLVDSGTGTHALINGFEVGDLIHMSKYDILEQPAKAEDDPFKTIYPGHDNSQPDPTVQDAVAPIRVRHEMVHDVQKTFVDGNIDAHGIYQAVIELEGNHQLAINNHIV